MDFQNRVGVKFGGGSQPADASQQNAERRERLKRLALETIDLSKDPYFMKNHVGSFECKLCLTIHTTESSYLAHTQGKKHSTNLARRAAREQKEQEKGGGVLLPVPVVTPAYAQQANYNHLPIRKVAVKIGRPGYKVTKIRDPQTQQSGLLFQVYYPDIVQGIKPFTRFMSAYEQRIEPPSKFHQYLLIAAEPYETVGFKIQSLEVDKTEENYWSYWDVDTKIYHFQFFFKSTRFNKGLQ